MLIKAPNKAYTGESFGVMFQHGVAHTDDPWLIGRFKEKGFTIEDEPVQPDMTNLEAENEQLKAKIVELEQQLAKHTEPPAELTRPDMIEKLKAANVEFPGNISNDKLKELYAKHIKGDGE